MDEGTERDRRRGGCELRSEALTVEDRLLATLVQSDDASAQQSVNFVVVDDKR